MQVYLETEQCIVVVSESVMFEFMFEFYKGTNEAVLQALSPLQCHALSPRWPSAAVLLHILSDVNIVLFVLNIYCKELSVYCLP